jgi:hypothetical protein
MIDKEHKPVSKSGYRNIYCSHYNICLDYAAKRYWSSFTCRFCTYISEQTHHIDLANSSDGSHFFSIPLEVIEWVE